MKFLISKTKAERINKMNDKEDIKEVINEVLNNLSNNQRVHFTESLVSIEIYKTTFDRIKLKSFLSDVSYGEYINQLVYADTKDIKNVQILNTLLKT